MDGLKNGLPVITHLISTAGYEVYQDSKFFTSFFDEKSFVFQFESMCEQISNKNINRNQIIDRYNQYFSFQAGCDRLRIALEPILTEY
jgi:hypothetical protein